MSYVVMLIGWFFWGVPIILDSVQAYYGSRSNDATEVFASARLIKPHFLIRKFFLPKLEKRIIDLKKPYYIISFAYEINNSTALEIAILRYGSKIDINRFKQVIPNSKLNKRKTNINVLLLYYQKTFQRI